MEFVLRCFDGIVFTVFQRRENLCYYGTFLINYFTFFFSFLFILKINKKKKFLFLKKKDPSAATKPDISIDLNGAFIESKEKLSNRKNVYLINTLLGLQVLIQSDNALVIAEWYREIHDAIKRLVGIN